MGRTVGDGIASSALAALGPRRNDRDSRTARGRARVFVIPAYAGIQSFACGRCGRPPLGEGQGDGGVGRGQAPPLHFNPLEGDRRARVFVIPAYAGIQSFACGRCGRPRWARDKAMAASGGGKPRPYVSRGRYDGRAPIGSDRPRGTSMPRRTLCTLLLLAAGAVCAAADPSLFQDLHWRMIGPFRGGRVLAVSGVPGQPDRFYFGAVNGGVWESRDAGRTWRPIFDGQPVNAIGALAVAPSDPDVLYVGTGEADMRSDIAQGDGMYRSADGGQTWAHIGLDDAQQIGRILVDPRDADRAFVAALGHPYGPNAERGVFRTTDGGRTWTKVLGPDDATGAIDLAFEPGNPDVLYAALWQARRTPWSVYPPLEGPGSGLWKSQDGGDHWTRIEGGGFPGRTGRIGLAVAPSRPDRVYALVDGPEGGLYRSEDAGAHWTRTSTDSRIWAARAGTSAASPWTRRTQTGSTSRTPSCCAPTMAAAPFLAQSGDLTGDDFHELWIDPADPDRQIVGSDQGAQVTVNGGRTWSSRLNQPTAQIYHVATDPGFPYRVYGAQQDSGAVSLPSLHDVLRDDRPGAVPRGHGRRRIRHDRARSGRSRDRLRRRRGPAGPAHRADPVGGPDAGRARPLPPRLDPAAGVLAARTQGPLLRQPDAVPHH